MTNIIFDGHGRTVATSKNLRGVLTFARKHPVDVVTVAHGVADHTYSVTFYFSNAGSIAFTCETTWQDWRVVMQWIAARRSWSVERVTFIGEWPQSVRDLEWRTIRMRGTIINFRE